MKIVDLSHLMNVHTPGWVGYAGNQMYYAQNLQTKMIVAQRIDTALHVGTHIDGAMHGTDGMGDMASYPLDFLVGAGAVVDVSRHMDDWAVITPEMIEEAPVEIREGDILIIHTGWHRYWEGQPRQDLVRYFCMHPGGKIELLEWMLKKKIKWFGIDCGSADHSMNTSIRMMRPDIAKRFLNWNPMAHVVISYQEILFFPGPVGHATWLLALGVASIFVFLGGYWFFDRLRDSFAEAV